MGARVLIIDDDPAVLKLFQLVLSDEGYEVHLLGEIDHAERVIQSVRPELIIVDHVFGQGQGLTLLRELRANPETANLPVIVCSAAAEQLRAYGACIDRLHARVVPKPFDLDDLLATVAESLSG